jgi:hypothetical protein
MFVSNVFIKILIDLIFIQINFICDHKLLQLDIYHRKSIRRQVRKIFT